MKVKEELYKIGLSNICEGNEIDNNSFLIIRNRVCDIFRQNNYDKIISSPKIYLYQYFTNAFTLQKFLRKTINYHYQRELTKIRNASSHNLNIAER